MQGWRGLGAIHVTENSVAVIVAAYKAADTIGAAIASALAQPETAEVIVVDDASPDATADAARASDDGTGRLSVIIQPENEGPSAARNLALDRVQSRYVAILDADDLLCTGRFAAMLAQPDWDIIADDIMFVPSPPDPFLCPPFCDGRRSRILTLDEFVARNIPAPSRPRAELGFLKPLISRAFIQRHGLRYDESMRLGEDFVFYARALAKGARFLLTEHGGYVAIQHPDSLSGRHATADLVALHRASHALQDLTDLSADQRALLRAHARDVAVKARYRQMLDDRHRDGPLSALARLMLEPGLAGPVLGAYLRDRRRPAVADIAPQRRLFGPDEFR